MSQIYTPSEQQQMTAPKKEYLDDYDDIKRFISYFYQIDIIRDVGAKEILEIGVGNKIVSNYLKNNDIKVITCDFNENLEPDVVADIRELPFQNNSFELVMACEILEHLPWDDFDKTLGELARVAKKYVLISLPYYSASFEFLFRFPMVGKIFKYPFVDLFLRIPIFWGKLKDGGEHYWEIGRKNYPIRKIRKAIKNRFIIKKEIRPILNQYHHFFLLEKKI